MSNEIELKLLVSDQVIPVIQQQLLPELNGQVTYTESQLFNHYYDTEEQLLGALKIGFRVRGKNGCFEQTVKTPGSSHGGLHSRPEFNQDLPNDQPDLSLFPASIWPPELDLHHVQQQLTLQFTTHFKRHCWLLSFTDGDQVELVFDTGKVEANDLSSDICELELELELVCGKVERLFDLAKRIVQLTPCRLGIQSKAARGYQLLSGNEPPVYQELAMIPVNENDLLTTLFSRSLAACLSHWQRHEQSYFQQKKMLSLVGIQDSLMLLHQVIVLYGDVIDHPQLCQLREDIEQAIGSWEWLPLTLSMKDLRAKKGYFSKKLSRHPELLSFLRGRIEGNINAENPLQWMMKSTALQLRISRLVAMTSEITLYDKTEGTSLQIHRWLENSWVYLTGVLSYESDLSVEDWLQHHTLLKNTLLRGVLLADYFGDETAKDFRGPWRNLLDGVEELFTLNVLQQEVQKAELDENGELNLWCESKITKLLPMLEQSREGVLAMTPYWHDNY